MSTPFDHLDKFKTLPPEVQSKIVEKFNTLPDEDKQTVMGKINTPMANRGTEGGGLQSVEPITDTLSKGLKSFKENAPLLSDALTEAGINPKLAQFAGKTFEHIPDIAMLAEGGPSAVKNTVKGAKAIGEAAMESSFGKALRYTGEKEAGKISEELAALPLRVTEDVTKGKEALTTAGKGIQKAEEVLNIGQKNTSVAGRRVSIDTPEKIVKFADRAEQLAQKGSDRLAEIGHPETLQFYRKTAEDALSKAGNTVAKETRNKLYAIKQTFTEAIGKTKEGIEAGFDEAMNKYKDIKKLVDALPAEATKEKRTLQLALQKAKNVAKQQARLRTTVGYSTGGAIALGVGKKAYDKVTGGN